MKRILVLSILLLLVTTLKAQFFIGSGQEVHVVNSALLYTGENVSGSGLMNVNLSTAESKGSISGISVNAINGTMVMSGSANQVINGGLYVDNSINRLFNSNTSSITIDGKVIVMDTLFMNTTGTPIIKMPSGDTLLVGAVVKNGGEFQLNGGVLHLNPNALDYTCSTVVKSDGGILSTANIIENRDVTFGTFNLITTATINLETVNNHIIRFANSSAVSWTGSQMTINGWQGAYDGTSGTVGKIYFGTSGSALTASQLEKIRFYDGTYYYDATLLSTGELVPAANTITTGSVATTICPGAGATSIPFTYTNEASFTVNTIFTVQLSDATGSFVSPTTLGTVVGDASGSQSLSYNFTTSNITAGTGYRIRVVSNMPAVDGSDNGSDITFQQVNTYYADTDGDTYGDANADSLACTAPVGYVTDNTDCIDASADQNPGETEACNSFDDDCDGQIDEGVETIFYADADGDTFGDLATTSSACTVPVGYVSNSTDCNDGLATVYPGATETCNTIDDDCDGTTDEGVQTTFYADADNDTFGDLATTTSACSAPAGYVSNSTDCNDGSATVYPGATETCNTIDDDCDGTTDEGVQTTFYADADSDTYGDLATTTSACSAPAGYVSNSTDCNDASATVYPGATETCNTVDDDCDGTTDEGVQTTFYADADNDTYGDLATTTSACSAPAGYVSNSTDCDDAAAGVNPGAAEACNSIDDDCDGTTDEGVQTTFYADADNDTYGDLSTTASACTAPAGYVSNSSDCNDASAAVNPGATETCNTVDDNCSGTTDEGVTTTYYEDNDNDTYGSTTSTVEACSLPAGYVTNNSDCNDNNGSVNPAGTELCGNSIDEDCSGSDLVCPDGGPGSALLLANIGFYGATSPTISVNLPVGTNSVENPGNGQDRWFKFVAQYNAIRVSLTGSNSVADDNDINLFDNPTQLGVQLIPIAGENAVSTSALGAAVDAGNEILIFDQLVPGQTYYICVRNNNSAPGVCGMICQYLRGSANDLGVVTSNTNTFSNSCQNFKSVYRFGASSYSIKRWTGATATGAPEFTFENNTQVGGVTSSFCQLGKFVVANLTNAPVQYTTKVDVIYNLNDAFGNAEVAVGVGTMSGTFTMSPELDLNVRTTDRCPVYKSATSGSIATNRSICGTQRYEYEFTQTLPTPSLPVYELGAAGGSRILAMSQVDGILGGQTYGVKIRSKHFDGVSNTSYGTSACVRTLGVAGMPTVDEAASEISNDQLKATLYPNPNAGQGFTLNVEGMDGDVTLNVTDATGKLVKSLRYASEGGFTAQVEFAQALASGLYQVEILNGISRHAMRMAVSR